ncbi:replication protein A 70 kDa DNA-binding subunit B-like [Miscanthus floridulus]|uniref:replication protein A 70 kDa DNA-binding subunit B-like n=1 Tax=Miscanthus floridulus TaxID=154761 RepID=UPI00345AB745
MEPGYPVTTEPDMHDNIMESFAEHVAVVAHITPPENILSRGNAIYAEISDDLIDGKAYLFSVGKVYVVKKFVVQNAKKSYRPVDKNLMIDITDYTTVELVRNPPHSIPEYVYRITPLRAIRPARVVFNLTDVLGYLIRYEAAHTFVPKNMEKAKTLREIYIKDLSENIMKITLWGEHATNFSIDNIYDAAAGNLIVCLVVGCIPREDFKNNDQTCLTGSSACTYYFNPTIPDACAYHSRFKDTPVYIEQPAPEEEAVPLSVQDIQLPERTIADLNHIDPFDDMERGPYKVAVTIVSITNTTNWWYMSCKPCKKRADQQLDGTYRCPKCGGTTTVPRYLLSFIAKDNTDEARFFAYDDEATKIIQKECQALVNPLHIKEGLPQAMNNILNKTYVLSVDLTDESCKSMKKRQYQVKAVLDRPPKRPPLQVMATSQYHPPHTTSPTPIIESPEHSADLLLIEAAEQSTPAHDSELEHEASKHDVDRSPTTWTGARKKLFGDTDSAEATDTQQDQRAKQPRPSSSESKSKKQKKKKTMQIATRWSKATSTSMYYLPCL